MNKYCYTDLFFYLTPKKATWAYILIKYLGMLEKTFCQLVQALRIFILILSQKFAFDSHSNSEIFLNLL